MSDEPKNTAGHATGLRSFAEGGSAVVVGSTGAIGAALVEAVAANGRFAQVLEFGRTTPVPLDLTDEASIEAAAKQVHVAGECRLIIDATGFLHDDAQQPEKSLRQLDPDRLARAFALNATGPALLMKHLLPVLPREGKSVFATLSARVGSIGDNRLGGWYAYRASKAALNQLVRTAAIELARRHPQAVCVALHPGTVRSPLSDPFAKAGLDVHSPGQAAGHLLNVIDGLGPDDTGGFFDWRGESVPW